MPCTHRGRRGKALRILNLDARGGGWSKPRPGLFPPRKWPQATHCRWGRINLWASLDRPGVDKVFCSQWSRDTSYNSICCFRHWIQQNTRLLIILILTVILIYQLMFTRFWVGMYCNVCRKWEGNRKVMVRWRDMHSRGLSKNKMSTCFMEMCSAHDASLSRPIYHAHRKASSLLQRSNAK